MDRTFLRSIIAAATVGGILQFAALVRADVLLDDRWADASRAEANRPTEAPVWVGREADVSVQAGAVATAIGPTSQKIWTYFTDKESVKLQVGQKLIASVSFIPRGALGQGTSRSFRIGLFHDPTSPRVEADVNSDSGGPDMPWKDAHGYAVQVLVTGDEYTGTKPFDLGKRLNMESESLLGTSGDYSKVSGGSPVGLKLDQEYTVTLAVGRVSETEVELTASYQQGENVLSTWSVVDDGSYLGSEPVYDQFDMLFIRVADKATSADKLEFTNFKVENTTTKPPN
jgi:hypothetical protein